MFSTSRAYDVCVGDNYNSECFFIIKHNKWSQSTLLIIFSSPKDLLKQCLDNLKEWWAWKRILRHDISKNSKVAIFLLFYFCIYGLYQRIYCSEPAQSRQVRITVVLHTLNLYVTCPFSWLWVSFIIFSVLSWSNAIGTFFLHQSSQFIHCIICPKFQWVYFSFQWAKFEISVIPLLLPFWRWYKTHCTSFFLNLNFVFTLYLHKYYKTHESCESILTEKVGWNRKFEPLLQLFKWFCQRKVVLFLLRFQLLTELFHQRWKLKSEYGRTFICLKTIYKKHFDIRNTVKHLLLLDLTYYKAKLTREMKYEWSNGDTYIFKMERLART